MNLSYEHILAAEDLPAISLFRHFVIEGGWITWFLLIPLSMLMVTLAIHYLITIRRGTQTPPDLARKLALAGQRHELIPALNLARGNESMLGQAAYAGLSRLTAGSDAARMAIEETVEECATRLFRRVEYLNVIGNVAPMIGLFGTVVGMIQAFNRLFAAGGGMPDASKLAGDIAVALVTTFWGLLIAIPALSAFALFRNRIDMYAAETAKLCEGLVTLLTTPTPSEARKTQATIQDSLP